MNILEKILNIFSPKKEEKLSNNIYDSTLTAEKSTEEVEKDLEKLKEFENKIAQSGQDHSENNSNNAEKKIPEYFDGLSIKNPFIGE